MVNDKRNSKKNEGPAYKLHTLPSTQYLQNKDKYITTVEAAESLGIAYSYLMKLKDEGKLGDVYNFGGKRLFVKADLITKLKTSGSYGATTIKRIKKKVSESERAKDAKLEGGINAVGDSVEVRILIPNKDYKALSLVLELSNKGDVNTFINNKIKDEIKKISSLFSDDK